MDLTRTIYCSEQIHIPPTYPYILKQYCKAAIRTQPYDLLKWSASYFKAVTNGEVLPIKPRLEYPPYYAIPGLTPGYLRVLIKQLGKEPKTMVHVDTIFHRWSGICLEEQKLLELLALLRAFEKVNWLQFVAVAVGSITNNLTETMILVCQVLTDEPEGGMATIPAEIFISLYQFLANLNCGPLTEDEIRERDEFVVEDDILKADTGRRESQIIVCEAGGEEEEADFESLYEEVMMAEEVGLKYEAKVMPVGEEQTSDAASLETEVDRMGSMLNKGDRRTLDRRDTVVTTLSDKQASRNSSIVLTKSGAATEKEVPSSRFNISNSESSEENIPCQTTPELKPVGTKESIEIASSVPSSETASEEREKKGGFEWGFAEEHSFSMLEEKSMQELSMKELEEKEDSLLEEEFNEISTPLLSRKTSKARVESMMRKIMKYKRQELPGIGGPVPPGMVQKVIEFMEICSFKQEGMLMPRNIKHWLCPPLFDDHDDDQECQ